MSENSIINDDYIDEDKAYQFLNKGYDGLNLLPGLEDPITTATAAEVLGVSIPTIERMLQDKQIKLTRKSILAYIFNHFLFQRPVMEQGEELEYTGDN